MKEFISITGFIAWIFSTAFLFAYVLQDIGLGIPEVWIWAVGIWQVIAFIYLAITWIKEDSIF